MQDSEMSDEYIGSAPSEPLVESSSFSVDLHSVGTWDDARINQFISQLPTEVLPAFMSKLSAAESEVHQVANLTFRNLSYVKDGINRLQRISGFVRSGSLVCVMGAPDSGTSTLLHALAGRITLSDTDQMSGEILIDGKVPASSFSKLVGYVGKEDTNLAMLTVRETLLFSARLRLSNSEMSESTLKLRVNIVMKLLGIFHIAESIVGDGVTRGISGGEKRRLSYGCELVAGHGLILSDQPTNGLDSATAFKLVSIMRQGAKAGRAAMCSLVQPSPELLTLFDYLLILSKGASMYFGPATHALAFFESAGFIKPKNKSLPDFLEAVSGTPHKFWNPTITRLPAASSSPSNSSSSDSVVVNDIEHAWRHCVMSYRQSEYYAQAGKVLFHDLSPPIPLSLKDKESTIRKSHFQEKYNSTLFQQIYLCLARQFIITYRDRSSLVGNHIKSLVIGLLLGSLFWDMGASQKQVRTRFGLVFFLMSFASTGTFQLVPLLMNHRAVYYMQKTAGYFSGLAYYISFIILQIPQAITEMFIFIVIVYPMCGLTNGIGHAEFWFCYLLLVVVNCTARAWVLFVSSFSKNQIMAQSLAPLGNIIFTVFSGYLVPHRSVPYGWLWAYFSSYFTYAIRGLIQNEMFDLQFEPCTTDAKGNIVGICVANPPTGHQVMSLYDMDSSDPNSKWSQMFYVFLFFILFNIGALISLLKINHSMHSQSELPNFESSTPGTQKRQQKSKGQSSKYDLLQDSLIDEDDNETQDDEVSVALDSSSSSQLRIAPVCLSFFNLGYSVDVPAPNGGNGTVEKKLLTSIFGYSKPGNMVALMGPSGGGKTTLLDVLAGKKTSGRITGDILVNGALRSSSFSRYSGYVEQFDSHNPFSTIREAIRFSGRLRLDVSLSDDDLEQRVDEVIDALGLRHVQHNIIGIDESTGGVGADVRKKCTIAVELITGPSILFLDEPTTGLDATGALAVMNAVRSLSRSISVICTIHQPSVEIIEKFDSILLLQTGGRVVYFGRVDQLSNYLGQNNLGQHDPEKNIADFALDVVVARGSDPSTSPLPSLFESSPQYATIVEDFKRGITPDSNSDSNSSWNESNIGGTKNNDSFTLQFTECLKRSFVSTVRNKAALKGRFFGIIFIGFVYGSMYYQLGTGALDAQNRVALLFLTVLITTFSASSVIPVIVDFRPVYFRETNVGMYRPLPMFLSRIVCDIPFIMIDTFLYSCLVYFIAGLRMDENGVHFGIFLLTYFLVRSTAFSYYELFAALLPTSAAVTAISAAFLTIAMLFGGFLISKNNIPTGWIWMYYLSFFRYPVAILSVNELHNFNFDCPSLPANSTVISNSCPIPNGDVMLSQFDMNPNDMWTNILALALFWVGFKFIGFVATVRIKHIKT